MEQNQFHMILQNQVKPSLEQLFPSGNGIFQQDNDPKHTARKKKKYLVDQGIHVLPWASQSPDLNPIENLWSILNCRLKNRQPQNKEQLFQELYEGWKELPVSLLEALVDSMPRRVAAVIANNGRATKY